MVYHIAPPPPPPPLPSQPSHPVDPVDLRDWEDNGVDPDHLTPQLMLMVSTLRSLPYAGTLLASMLKSSTPH